MLLIKKIFPVYFLTLISIGTSWATSEPALPTEILKSAEVIQKEKSREKRLELLTAMISDVKTRLKQLPETISDSDVPAVQMLYELDILFGSFRAETINPTTCPEIRRSLMAWANQDGGSEAEISSSGRLVLDVVKSVCGS